MKLVEVLPLVKIQRPFDAKRMREQKISTFRYYSVIRPQKTVAEMNWLTRHLLEQNEFLVMTVQGSTYLERGASLNRLEPMAFFNNAFDCGRDSTETDTFCDCLVNMTKMEVPIEIRALLYGKAPLWKPGYAGVKLVLCRKTAVLPECLLGKELPVIHLPEPQKPE